MHLRKAAEDVSVLKMRCSINADTMTKAELHQKLKTGYRDIGKGRVRNASKAFEEWQRKRRLFLSREQKNRKKHS
jgi:hypothetical protein